MAAVRVAALVPIKRFTAAKGRLAEVVGPDDRAELARWMAEGVVTAFGDIDVFVACDDDDVADWARSVGASVSWGPGLGLNGALDDGVNVIAAAGYDHVVISHADLPLPATLPLVAREATITLVPDRRRDGTNVCSFPLAHPIRASYGKQSFGRHLALALAQRVPIEVRVDPLLSLDVDTAADLTHPYIKEVLPQWLRTNLVNPT